MPTPYEIRVQDLEIRDRVWIREKAILVNGDVMVGMFAFIDGREVSIIRDNSVEHIYPIRFDLINWSQNA